MPFVAKAEFPPEAADTAAILERLDRQDAEILRLRTQLAKLAAEGATDAKPMAVPIDEPPPLPAATLEPIAATLNDLRPASAEAAKKEGSKKSPDDWIDLSTEKWTVKLGGHVQGDYVQWADASPSIPDQNYFEFRRLRLMADGTGYGMYDFRLQMDFAGTNPQVKDAYLTINEVDWLQRVRIGNFFVPFGLEQVTNDTNNIFLERSIPTQGVFTGDREVGIASYGVSDDLNKTWSFGAFFDSISEETKVRVDDNQGIRLSGRATWLPYYDEPSNGRYLVHTGVGVLYTDDQDDLVRFAARPQIRLGPQLIDSGNLPAGSYTTGNLELATVLGPLSLQSEWFLSSVNFIGRSTAFVYGGYLYASYFLTGENRIYERYGQHGAQFGRNVPYSNFFLIPGGHGPGGWELKARTSYLDLSKVDKGRYNDLTIGMNWYWSDRTRVMFDWIHPWTTADTPFGTTQSDILATRFDFNF